MSSWVILDFNFWRYPHVLTLANDYVTTALQLVVNELNQNFGAHGLGRSIFYVGNSLTVTVLSYRVSDYGEREDETIEGDEEGEEEDNAGDDAEEEEEDYDYGRPDPQCRT